MTPEETLLISWRNSLPQNSIISNDYSIENGVAILTMTRCLNENDLGKTLIMKCPATIRDIEAAIELLSSNRERLSC